MAGPLPCALHRLLGRIRPCLAFIHINRLWSVFDERIDTELWISASAHKGTLGKALFRNMTGEANRTTLLRTIIERHYDGLREFFIRRTNSPETADDLTQSTFLKLAKVRSLERKCESGYIYKIARSIYADYYARQQRPFPSSERISVPDSDRASIDSDEAQAMQEEIERLPEECRTILVLRLYQDYSFREASVMLGIPETTLVARYNKAVRCLKKVINLRMQ